MSRSENVEKERDQNQRRDRTDLRTAIFGGGHN